MYTIDKNVEMPSGKTEWPFKDMEVGDSFFAPGKNTRQLQNASSHYRKIAGMKFRAAAVTEDGVEGARIWRIE